jgi:nitrogen fixation NifU-like protein
MEYSEVVLDHLKNPRNMGKIIDPDGVGEVGNPICGDMMTIMIKVRDDRIEEIKFSSLGCGAAIAVSSLVTEMAKGKTLEEALTITNRSVAESLGGLPKNELHCANLGADALHNAVMDYLTKKAGIRRKERGGNIEYIGEKEGKCRCPYCDVEIPSEVRLCSKCGKPIPVNTLNNRK